jgi:hypothetical protein
MDTIDSRNEHESEPRMRSSAKVAGNGRNGKPAKSEKLVKPVGNG